MDIIQQLNQIRVETTRIKTINPDYAVNVESGEYQLVIATPAGVEDVSESLPFDQFIEYIRSVR